MLLAATRRLCVLNGGVWLAGNFEQNSEVSWTCRSTACLRLWNTDCQWVSPYAVRRAVSGPTQHACLVGRTASHSVSQTLAGRQKAEAEIAHLLGDLRCHLLRLDIAQAPSSPRSYAQPSRGKARRHLRGSRRAPSKNMKCQVTSHEEMAPVTRVDGSHRPTIVAIGTANSLSSQRESQENTHALRSQWILGVFVLRAQSLLRCDSEGKALLFLFNSYTG